jgi:hypothetical protein
MIGARTNHLFQSTLFAIAAGLLTLAFRKNHAKVHYWLWLSASLKFLIPFSLLIGVGNQLGWTSAARKLAPQVAGQSIQFTVEQISDPFAQAVTPTPSMAGHIDWFPVIPAMLPPRRRRADERPHRLHRPHPQVARKTPRLYRGV